MYLVYKITNKINNKVYVGRCKEERFYARKKHHELTLRHNKHHCKELQDDYNIYTNEDFEISIIEKCKSLEDSKLRESYWIEHYKKLNLCYNIKIGDKHDKQTKEKISKALKGKVAGEGNGMYGKKHSIATRQKISLKAKNRKNPMEGRKHSVETREKISKALKGKLSGERNGMYGKKHKKESIEKMSLNRKGKKHTEEFKIKRSIQYSGSGNPRSKITIEDSRKIKELLNKGMKGKEIATMFNINPTIISKIKNNTHWTCKVIEGEVLCHE